MKVSKTLLPLLSVTAAIVALGLPAQVPTHNAPIVDGSAEASPLQPTNHDPVVDGSQQASPVGKGRAAKASLPGRHDRIAANTEIQIALTQPMDSGSLHNGEHIAGTLAQPVRTANGHTLPAGTPVRLTVISNIAAGQISAVGEFSIELTRVGAVHLFTEVQTWRGKAGKRDVADSAPALGTNAGFPTGRALTFRVAATPTDAVHRLTGHAAADGPGSITGIAVGSPGSAKTAKYGKTH